MQRGKLNPPPALTPKKSQYRCVTSQKHITYTWPSFINIPQRIIHLTKRTRKRKSRRAHIVFSLRTHIIGGFKLFNYAQNFKTCIYIHEYHIDKSDFFQRPNLERRLLERQWHNVEESPERDNQRIDKMQRVDTRNTCVYGKNSRVSIQSIWSKPSWQWKKPQILTCHDFPNDGEIKRPSLALWILYQMYLYCRWRREVCVGSRGVTRWSHKQEQTTTMWQHDIKMIFLASP